MARHYYGYYDYFYPRSQPREAKGGIKAQSKRGAFAKSWWATRWIKTLESFNIGGRLSRGRSYARRGQVLSIDIEKGVVQAKVQGSRATPYKVKIVVATLSDKDWEKVVTELRSQVVYAAKLLAGEMPQDIDEVFQKAGASLFPQKQRDLSTDCSCPDWSNPCKHIAAVYYLLGEEFDRDPFLIFKLRGRSREELIKELGDVALLEEDADHADAHAAPPPEEPLPIDAAEFWQAGPLTSKALGEVGSTGATAALPKRLGGFPFWRGAEPFLDTLEEIYADAAQVGLSAFLADRSENESAAGR